MRDSDNSSRRLTESLKRSVCLPGKLQHSKMKNYLGTNGERFPSAVSSLRPFGFQCVTAYSSQCDNDSKLSNSMSRSAVVSVLSSTNCEALQIKTHLC